MAGTVNSEELHFLKDRARVLSSITQEINAERRSEKTDKKAAWAIKNMSKNPEARERLIKVLSYEYLLRTLKIRDMSISSISSLLKDLSSMTDENENKKE